MWNAARFGNEGNNIILGIGLALPVGNHQGRYKKIIKYSNDPLDSRSHPCMIFLVLKLSAYISLMYEAD